MSDRHVVPSEDGWNVEKDNAQRPSAKAPTQAEAIKRAVEIVSNDGGGQVVVHGTDGNVRETRTVSAGSEDTTAEAARTAASAAGAGREGHRREGLRGGLPQRRGDRGGHRDHGEEGRERDPRRRREDRCHRGGSR